MTDDSTEHPKPAGTPKARRGPQPDVPPELAAPDVDTATATADEDEEARLPEALEELVEAIGEGPLAIAHAAIENALRLAPTPPGVYRMLNPANDVLYVGKPKNVRKRLPSDAGSNAPHPARTLPMIAPTLNLATV